MLEFKILQNGKEVKFEGSREHKIDYKEFVKAGVSFQIGEQKYNIENALNQVMVKAQTTQKFDDDDVVALIMFREFCICNKDLLNEQAEYFHLLHCYELGMLDADQEAKKHALNTIVENWDSYGFDKAKFPKCLADVRGYLGFEHPADPQLFPVGDFEIDVRGKANKGWNCFYAALIEEDNQQSAELIEKNFYEDLRKNPKKYHEIVMREISEVVQIGAMGNNKIIQGVKNLEHNTKECYEAYIEYYNPKNMNQFIFFEHSEHDDENRKYVMDLLIENHFPNKQVIIYKLTEDKKHCNSAKIVGEGEEKIHILYNNSHFVRMYDKKEKLKALFEQMAPVISSGAPSRSSSSDSLSRSTSSSDSEEINSSSSVIFEAADNSAAVVAGEARPQSLQPQPSYSWGAMFGGLAGAATTIVRRVANLRGNTSNVYNPVPKDAKADAESVKPNLTPPLEDSVRIETIEPTKILQNSVDAASGKQPASLEDSVRIEPIESKDDANRPLSQSSMGDSGSSYYSVNSDFEEEQNSSRNSNASSYHSVNSDFEEEQNSDSPTHYSPAPQVSNYGPFKPIEGVPVASGSEQQTYQELTSTPLQMLRRSMKAAHAVSLEKARETFVNHAKEKPRYRYLGHDKSKFGFTVRYGHPDNPDDIITYELNENLELTMVNYSDKSNAISAPIKTGEGYFCEAIKQGEVIELFKSDGKNIGEITEIQAMGRG